MLEPSEGPHITPEDYVAQDEIFKVGPASRCLEDTISSHLDVLAGLPLDRSGFLFRLGGHVCAKERLESRFQLFCRRDWRR